MTERQNREWMKDALCADFDTAQQKLRERGVDVSNDELYPDMFFSAEYGVSLRNEKVQRMAKSICELCLVKDECLEYALRGGNKTSYGIYGGRTKRERQRMKNNQESIE